MPKPVHPCAGRPAAAPEFSRYLYIRLDAAHPPRVIAVRKQAISTAVIVAVGNRYADAQGLQSKRLAGGVGDRSGE